MCESIVSVVIVFVWRWPPSRQTICVIRSMGAEAAAAQRHMQLLVLTLLTDTQTEADRDNSGGGESEGQGEREAAPHIQHRTAHVPGCACAGRWVQRPPSWPASSCPHRPWKLLLLLLGQGRAPPPQWKRCCSSCDTTQRSEIRRSSSAEQLGIEPVPCPVLPEPSLT